MNSLARFHPLVNQWFLGKYGKPTAVQEKAWETVSQGNHTLISAPTGSGKTLAAFLWAIDEIIRGEKQAGAIRVLYISPLKALNNDVQKNLNQPLTEIKTVFSGAGIPFPPISVMTRSGDTTQRERRAMLSHPPEILITTPESLNILLSSSAGARLFHSISTVILDEIHAVIESKRGTHLLTALERLTRLAGEFQRISLSATVNPLSLVARHIGGRRMVRQGAAVHYQERPVEIIEDDSRKSYLLSIDAALIQDPAGRDDTWWAPLVSHCLAAIRRNRSTLIFTGSRKKTEKFARLINEAAGEIIAYSHHGALSREIRLFVEDLLKQGRLKAIVATGTLELGIDIGELDEVILIQSPNSVAQAVQRIGRAGHAVSGASKASLVPLDGVDFIHLGALAGAVSRHLIESLSPPEQPLDVLAQVILSMAGVETWKVDDLFHFIKSVFAYRDLSRADFDSVVGMLAGKFEKTRIAELRPRIILDGLDGSLKARKGSQMLIYSSGGMIPDRGYYELRLADSQTRLGELDEEFVWERNIGDTFVFGPSVWRIRQITQSAVLVTQANQPLAMIPFYRAEEQNRSFHLSQLILELLETLSALLDKPDAAVSYLVENNHFSEESALSLIRYLITQREKTKRELPHRRHIVIEHCRIPYAKDETQIVLMHTFWGGKVNKPFSEAFCALWEEKFGYPLEHYANNDTILFHLPHDFSQDLLHEMLDTPDFTQTLFRRIAGSALFGAVFRENAGRALLLPRAGFSRRMPFWLTRIKAKNLLSAVLSIPGFPLLKETLANLRDSFFDMDALEKIRSEILDRTIRISETTTNQPSPFAAQIVWYMTNQYMYQTDELKSGRMLPRETLEETLAKTKILPPIPRALVSELEEKLLRSHPAYAPADVAELFLLLQERLAVPLSEWNQLLAAMERTNGLAEKEIRKFLSTKAVIFYTISNAALITLIENLPELCSSLAMDPYTIRIKSLNDENLNPEKYALQTTPEKNQDESDSDPEGRFGLFLAQFMRFYGPLRIGALFDLFGLPESDIVNALEALAEEDETVCGTLIEDEKEVCFCDRENYNRLLRMKRRALRQTVKTVALDFLPLFLASRHGLIEKIAGEAALKAAFDRLFSFPAKSAAWEKYILPARVADYSARSLDLVLGQTSLCWTGCGRNKIAFAFPEDLSLLDIDTRKEKFACHALFPDPRGRYTFEDLVAHTRIASDQLLSKLWDGVWAGIVSNTAFASARLAIDQDFHFGKNTPSDKRRLRWKTEITSRGFWYLLDTPEPSPDPPDPVLELERNKDRARLLLDRYGIVFRELLAHEAEPFQWGNIFPALRLMELSGELTGGSFFSGIPGIQFMSLDAQARLAALSESDRLFWINACDPVSLSGKALPALRNIFPDRIETTYLVFQGSKIILVLRKNGAELDFRTAPEDPLRRECIDVFHFLIERAVNPLKLIKVRQINGKEALQSPYKKILIGFGFQEEYKSLVLRKKFM